MSLCPPPVSPANFYRDPSMEPLLSLAVRAAPLLLAKMPI
jgi:hypothetical protein